MHSVPPSSRRSARAAGLLARLRFRAMAVLGPLGTLIVVLRRTRILPLGLAALTLAAFALTAAATPYDDDAGGSAVDSSASAGAEGLVPATGDGWNQDGAPAVTSPAQEGPTSPSAASPRPSGSPPVPATAGSASSRSSSGTSAAAVEPTRDVAPGTTARSSTGSSSGASSGTSSAGSSSPTSTPSSSSTSATASATAAAGSPSGSPSAPTPAENPADRVLSAVNAARTAAGCATLTADADLASVAAEHSAAMRDGDFLGVRPADGGAPVDRGSRTAVVATGTDPAAVADGWLADDTLLNCRLTAAGVATTDGYWTLVAT